MTLLLLRYRLRMFLRLLRDHFFTLFVLAPMILAGFFYTVEPGIEMLLNAVGGITGSSTVTLVVTSIGLAAWTLLFWPAALNEIAPSRSADAYLDALPVPAVTRFHSSLAAQVARNAVAAVILLAGISPEYLSRPEPHLFALTAASLQLGLVAVNRFYGKTVAIALGVVCCLAVAAASLTLSGLVAPLAAYGAALALVLGSRRGERASDEGSRSWRRGVMLRLPKRLGEVRPQLLRDLLLTSRFFSPAVPFAAAGAVTALALGWSLRYSAGERWSAEILLAGCGLATLALSSLAPLMLRSQIPAFWLEQSSPIEPDSIWKTKVWFGGLISTPPFFVVLLMLATLADESMAIIAAQALIVTLTISSTIVMLMFEVIDRPLLGLTLAWLIGSALAGTYVLFWEYIPFMALLHAYLLHNLAMRAQQTAARIGGPPL